MTSECKIRFGIIFMTYVFFIVYVCRARSEVSTNIYRRPRLASVKDRSDCEMKMFSDTQTDCAAICQRTPSCETFFFEEQSGTCHLGRNRFRPQRVFSKNYNCPEETGYYTWIFPNMVLCTKYHYTPVNYTVASGVCKAEGGHLVLVLDNSVRLNIIRMFNELDISGMSYFDGYEYNDNGVYVSSNGQTITDIVWSDGNPHGNVGEHCLGGHSDDGYLFKDIICSHEYPFLCQIDVM